MPDTGRRKLAKLALMRKLGRLPTSTEIAAEMGRLARAGVGEIPGADLALQTPQAQAAGKAFLRNPVVVQAEAPGVISLRKVRKPSGDALAEFTEVRAVETIRAGDSAGPPPKRLKKVYHPGPLAFGGYTTEEVEDDGILGPDE